ncbi:type I restriction endonuclease [Helicobacter pylori]|uniref:type I restriction endonuclease n=1 Tax=Helicobacter pylori TaxID=210 RepID=UPI0029291AFC|nr:type I restriction endonuclease [Helicobacter pylori]MDU9806044.1 type I restriction endonuclease [Helicobacter pylori]
MNFKRAIIAYLSHKRTENARNKKIIFDIMKPLKGVLTTSNKTTNQKKQKKGLLSWKTTQTITKRH